MDNKKSDARNVAPNQNTFLITGGESKGFDFSDVTENTAKTQPECDLCNPQINRCGSMLQLCEECTAAQTRLETELLAEIAKPRKAFRLHRCSGCQRCVTPAKFSRGWGIYKVCVADVLSKSKLARSHFINRAVNNFHRMLKGVSTL